MERNPNPALKTWQDTIRSIRNKERRDVLNKLKHAAWEIPFPVHLSISTRSPKRKGKDDKQALEPAAAAHGNGNDGNVLVQTSGSRHERKPAMRTNSQDSVTSIEDEEGHDLFLPPNPNRNPTPPPIPIPIPVAAQLVQQVKPAPIIPLQTPKQKQKRKREKPKRVLKIYLDSHTGRGNEWLAKVRSQDQRFPAGDQSVNAGGKKVVQEGKAGREVMFLLYKLKEEVEYEKWRGKSAPLKPLKLVFKVRKGGSENERNSSGLEEGEKIEIWNETEEENIKSKTGEKKIGSERLVDEKKRGNGKRKRAVSEEDERFEIQSIINRGPGKRRVVKKVKWEPGW